MTAVFGRIEEFDSAKENWVEYEERLEFFFAANEITSDDKTLKRRVNDQTSSGTNNRHSVRAGKRGFPENYYMRLKLSMS